MRLEYPANIRIIKLPCTGRVDLIHLLKALEGGADGVLVAGCLEGDCHFRSGNVRARKRVTRVRETLARIGLGAERVAMYNLSAGMGQQFAEVAREFTDRVRQLGPSPVRRAREKASEVAA